MTIKTKYYGIYIEFFHGRYWISDDRGNQQYIGTALPTDREVSEYAEDRR